MKHLALGATLALLITVLAGSSVAQVRKINVSRLGPQVGATVPDFNLSDQHGKQWTLQSVMGPNGAMIVFFRSADW
jgi:hypothetical protein